MFAPAAPLPSASVRPRGRRHVRSRAIANREASQVRAIKSMIRRRQQDRVPSVE